MTETSTACKNCGTTLVGKFCQTCGQKADIHKITLKYLLHEFFHALTHADKGILFLIKQLAFRPGYVAKDYIEGKRKKYFNPLSFLVIVSAIFAMVAMESGYFEALNGSRGNGQGYQGMPDQYARYMNESMRIVIQHGKMISLILMVPLITFLSWIFFRKPRYNYAENLVLQSLIVGQVNVGMILIFIPAYLLFGHASLNNFVFQLTFLTYMIVAYRQFFKNNIFLTIIKTIFIQLLFIIFFWILILSFVFLKQQIVQYN